MALGTPISRHCLVTLHNGTTVMDWGDGRYQDLMSGDFITAAENQISHTILDEELIQLIHSGRVESFDTQTVYLYPLPEPPRPTID